MTNDLSRRDFLAASTAASLAAATRPDRGAPAVIIRPDSRPCVVASANGIRGVARAYELMMRGTDTLDAAVEGVKIQELDPSDQSVGYGGLPNAEGVVQLDASCMHGPTRRAGAVACLEGIKTPSEVARLVLRYTSHVLLVGAGAQRFALSFGFHLEDLLTEESRQAWLHWRANQNPGDNWLDVPDAEPIGRPPTGTINMDIVNARGDLSSVTTTAGLAFKIPGRVGDSAIHGAGQYTDNDVGAAGSTGLGEINIKLCGAYTTVDGMRRGLSPTDACLETLRRCAAVTEPRLLDAQGRPRYDLVFYAVNKRGDFGAAATWSGEAHGRFAVCDERGPRHADVAYLHEGAPPP